MKIKLNKQLILEDRDESTVLPGALSGAGLGAGLGMGAGILYYNGLVDDLNDEGEKLDDYGDNLDNQLNHYKAHGFTPEQSAKFNDDMSQYKGDIDNFNNKAEHLNNQRNTYKYGGLGIGAGVGLGIGAGAGLMSSKEKK